MDHIPDSDVKFDPSAVNIFRPLQNWKPIAINSDDRSDAQIPSLKNNKQEKKEPPAKPSTNATDSSNLYCKACKKKFSNTATWQNHLKSAKHIANEKKQGKPNEKVIDVSKATKGVENSETTDAKQDLSRALDKLKSDPEAAVSTLWILSKQFYASNWPGLASEALHGLVTYFQETVSNGGSGESLALQTRNVAFLCRLALGRLWCLYRSNASLNAARILLLDALEAGFNIKKDEILKLAMVWRRWSLEQIFSECQKLCSFNAEENVPIERQLSLDLDGNDSLETLLCEISGAFYSPYVKHEHTVEFKSMKYSSADIAIVLLCAAVTISREDRVQRRICLQSLTKIFGDIGMAHREAEALVVVIDLNGELSDHWKDDLLSIFLGLLYFVEIGDHVRAQKIIDRMKPFLENVKNKIGPTSFPDLQYLIDVATARKHLNHLALEYTLPENLDHLLLLLESTETEMLLREVTDSNERLSIVDRLASLA